MNLGSAYLGALPSKTPQQLAFEERQRKEAEGELLRQTAFTFKQQIESALE
jgi:hypothetical protein